MDEIMLLKTDNDAKKSEKFMRKFRKIKTCRADLPLKTKMFWGFGVIR